MEELENLSLKNKVVGIIDKDKIDGVLSELYKNDVPREKVSVISAENAKKIVDVKSEKMSLMNKIKKTIDRNIGGGPAEFIRDVKKIEDTQCLLVIDVNNENTKDKIFSILRKQDSHRIKYFHPFYVEYGTVEKDHRQMESI